MTSLKLENNRLKINSKLVKRKELETKYIEWHVVLTKSFDYINNFFYI